MAAPTRKIPVSMLSGFLGSGKTTLLRYLLENSKEKIACVVNDVAAINIDAKLVRNDRNRARGEQTNTTSDLADTIELQNGCACCTLQDELFQSFEQILALADKRGEPYARIVLENSGVAEPQQIRDKFAEAAASGHPVMERIELDSLITVVDSSTFVADYASRTPLASRPELGDGGNLRPVVDLLVEQVECADHVILNKTDLMPPAAAPDAPGSTDQLVAIVSTLNPLAAVHCCTQAKVPLDKVFGSAAHAVVAKLNVEGQHRGAVAAARAAHEEEEEAHKHHHHHHGEHKHSHAEDGHKHDDCKARTDGHDHGHKHHDHDHHHHHGEHKHNHAEDGHKHDDCKACTDHHDHGHDHHDGHGHDHHHGHGHDHHHHDHGHDHHHDHHHHERPQTRAAARFGIKSFVYSRRRPFHPQRLKEMVLKWIPVATNTAIDGEAPSVGDSPIKTVLRSKGFMWMSNSHTTAYYWSHAGQHFEISDEGDWWAAVPSEEWPEERAQVDTILEDFDPSTTHGDRRQEIVFIGVGMDESKISEQLDAALLTDNEMASYVQRWASKPDPDHPQVEQLRKKSRSGHA